MKCMLGETLPGSCGDLPQRSDDFLVVTVLRWDGLHVRVRDQSEEAGATGCREAGCLDAAGTIRTIDGRIASVVSWSTL